MDKTKKTAPPNKKDRWEPIYLVSLDTVDFETIPDLASQMSFLKDSVPSNGSLILLISFMCVKAPANMEEEVRNVWMTWLARLNGDPADVWTTLAMVKEGLAIVALNGFNPAIREGIGNTVSMYKPPTPTEDVDFGRIVVYLELPLLRSQRDEKTMMRAYECRKLAIIWTPSMKNTSPHAENGYVLSSVQLYNAMSTILSMLALQLEYDKCPMPPNEADMQKACRGMVSRVDGILSLMHVRTMNDKHRTNQHMWHAAGKFRALEGKMKQGQFEPNMQDIPIRALPCCYKIQGRTHHGLFPYSNRLYNVGETWLDMLEDRVTFLGRWNKDAHHVQSDSPFGHAKVTPSSSNDSPSLLKYASDEANKESEALCVVCWEKEATIVAKGCGHLVFCGICRGKSCVAKDMSNHKSEEFRPSKNKTKKSHDDIALDCPICRKKSTTVHKSKYSGQLYF